MPAEALLDSGILIRHLRDYSGYAEITEQLSKQWMLYISSFSRFEIFLGMRNYERDRTMHLLDTIICLPINAEVADLAGNLVCTWRKQGVTLGEGDVLIAATAIFFELELITTNARHFPMPELSVWQADEAGQLKLWERE